MVLVEIVNGCDARWERIIFSVRLRMFHLFDGMVVERIKDETHKRL